MICKVEWALNLLQVSFSLILIIFTFRSNEIKCDSVYRQARGPKHLFFYQNVQNLLYCGLQFECNIFCYFVAGFGKPYCRKYKTHYPLIFVLEQKTTKTKLLSANLSFYQRQLSSSKNLDMEAKVNVTIFKSTTASTKSGTSHHYTSLLTTEVL